MNENIVTFVHQLAICWFAFVDVAGTDAVVIFAVALGMMLFQHFERRSLIKAGKAVDLRRLPSATFHTLTRNNRVRHRVALVDRRRRAR
ncbi:hypothetical protein R75461_07258 [Paraburkholderia nemoris]|nr:hypothetical protein [Paraburkholderia aspalathi]MBK3786087.1 hypothetical protein [Paraburkholderia aspalathi]CAE6846301.1 hypothetical protein R75461_07258 [Paraburkholderia nemoris]